MNSFRDGNGVSRITAVARIFGGLLGTVAVGLGASILFICILRLLGWQDLDRLLHVISLLTTSTIILLTIAAIIYVGLRDERMPRI